MNRTLRRPMFRMGGAAEGITSGLDKPRQNYFDAGRVIPTQEEFEQVKSMYPQFERPKGEGLSRFLMSTGLNLLSTPPQGGLLSTIATSAKGPTEQLFKDIDTERASQFATDADLFKTLLEAKGDAAGGTTGKTYAKLQIATDIENTMGEITKLKQDLKNDPTNETLKNDLAKKEARLNYLGKENATGKALMGQTEFVEDVLDGIIDVLKKETNPDGTKKYPDVEGTNSNKNNQELLKEAYRQFYEFFDKIPEREEAKASGGRVGRRMGTPMTGEQPMAQETQMSDQGPKIDFATLRARLPKEIGDDIVRLVAQSPEALEDFATIATQQDVDQFNKKYSVNLVLPQEA
jgi:hypothetical protein